MNFIGKKGLIFGVANHRSIAYHIAKVLSDRGASIRIPVGTVDNGWKGRLEDRRPSANMDPYIVCTLLIQTVCAEKLVEA